MASWSMRMMPVSGSMEESAESGVLGDGLLAALWRGGGAVPVLGGGECGM